MSSRQITRFRWKTAKKLEKFAEELTDTPEKDVEFGRNVEVDGNLIINDITNIVNNDGNPLLRFKTLFGNKSILGNGNVDLYRHFITLNGSLYLNFYSSSNLICDSLQDLTTLTKAVNGTKIAVGSTYIVFNGSTWATANNTSVTSVSDIVTTI